MIALPRHLFYCKWPSSASFSFIYGIFKQSLQNLQQFNVENDHAIDTNSFILGWYKYQMASVGLLMHNTFHLIHHSLNRLDHLLQLNIFYSNKFTSTSKVVWPVGPWLGQLVDLIDDEILAENWLFITSLSLVNKKIAKDEKW